MREPAYVTQLRRRGCRFRVGNISPYNLVANFMLFRRIFRQEAIDVVFTHFGVERFWATFFGKLFGKVTVWNEHWHSLGTRYAGLKRFFYGLFVDHFIAVSDFIAATLPKTGTVHSVHNAISIRDRNSNDQTTRQAIRRQLGLAPDTVLILMVAAFRAEKRHMLALKICRQVVRHQERATFLFLGDGRLREQFLLRVAEHGLERFIRAPGYAENVEQYYRAADLAMLTSFQEPFGYAVLEAMGHGLPIVAFASGGPAEMIENGHTGFLVAEGGADQFAHHLIRLVAEPALRSRLGENARVAARTRFSRERWVREVGEILIQAGARRRPAMSLQNP